MHALLPHHPKTLLPRLTTTTTTKSTSLSHDHSPHHHPHSLSHAHTHQQIRHATLIPRPQRPYTFTQLVTLSDGSTYTHRTTSPAPIFRSQRDTRNSPLWNPSSAKLLNVEADEAGKLRRFREKFGRGWDASTPGSGGDGGEKEGQKKKGREGGGGSVSGSGSGSAVEGGEGEGVEEDNLLDLISGYGREAEAEGTAAGVQEDKRTSGKGKGGEN